MVVIPANLKGLDYCGTFRVTMDENLTEEDARKILAESPKIGISILEKQEEQPKKRKKRGQD